MVFEKLKKLICDQLDIEEEKITENSSITDDLGADSLDMVDLIMSVEEEFDIDIPEESVENISKVGDVVKYIESLI
ncbi:MAG: acyl carrier protein [Oscillospiraceae bacterium]